MPSDSSLEHRSGAGIQVIARAAAVLRALKNTQFGLSLAQIAERADLPRSTVQRIVNALLAETLVVSAGPEGGYRLGPEIQALARSSKIDLVAVARPHIVALSHQTGETVDLSMLRGSEVLFIDQITGTHRLRTISAVGEIFPLTNTANGKACLLQLGDKQALSLIEQELAAGRGAVGRSARAILKEIIEMRRSGISLNLDEHTHGISAVGIGFRDAVGDIYAISVPIPTPRFNQVKQSVVDAMRLARAAIVQDIGGEPAKDVISARTGDRR